MKKLFKILVLVFSLNAFAQFTPDINYINDVINNDVYVEWNYDKKNPNIVIYGLPTGEGYDDATYYFWIRDVIQGSFVIKGYCFVNPNGSINEVRLKGKNKLGEGVLYNVGFSVVGFPDDVYGTRGYHLNDITYDSGEHYFTIN